MGQVVAGFKLTGTFGGLGRGFDFHEEIRRGNHPIEGIFPVRRLARSVRRWSIGKGWSLIKESGRKGGPKCSVLLALRRYGKRAARNLCRSVAPSRGVFSDGWMSVRRTGPITGV